MVSTAAADPGKVTEAYETLKRNYTPPGETETTEEQCQRRGIKFMPMVVECHGGSWGTDACQTLDAIAKGGATAWNEAPEAISLRIAQRMSMTLHRENARAILRRRQALEAAPVIEEVPIDGPMSAT